MVLVLSGDYIGMLAVLINGGCILNGGCDDDGGCI